MRDLDTKLHNAIKSFQCDRIEELLKNGANPNAQDENGWTAGHILI